MQRGGTIEWILTLNDSDFDRVADRVERRSRILGREVDKNIKDGTDNSNRSLQNFRTELSRSASFLRNFQVATRGFNMTTMILGVTAATGAIVELASALAASGGALLPLPGIMATVAGAVGTVRVATLGLEDAFDAIIKGDAEDLAEAMKKLSPAGQEVVKAFGDIKKSFDPVQKAIQQAFFVDLGSQMRQVANTSLPVLRTGMEQVATSINGLLKEAAKVSQEPFFQGAIRDTLAGTATATNTLTGAVRPLSQALAGLVQIGVPYTNMLAQWVVTLSQQAAAYVNSENGQRQLNAAIVMGVDALQKLGDLIGAVAKLLISLFKVSNQEGLSFIETLTNAVNKVNEWVNTAEGQERMAALFRTTNEVLSATLEVIGRVAIIILDIINAFDQLPEPVQQTVIQFLAWTAVLTPIVTYVTALGTSLRLTVAAIGLLKGPVGAITEGLSLFGQGFKDARVAASVFSGVMGSLGGVVRTIMNVIVTVISIGARAIGAAIFSIPVVGWILLAITALVGLFTYFYNTSEEFRNFVNNIFAGIGDFIKKAFEGIGQFFTGLWNGIMEGVRVVGEFFTNIWNGIVSVVTTVFNTIMAVYNATLKPVIDGIIYIITALFTIWWTVWTAIGTIVWTVVSTIVQIIGVILYGSFMWLWNNVLVPLGNFFAEVWNGIVKVVTDTVNAISKTISDVWNGIVAFLTPILQGIAQTISEVWNGIVNTVNGLIQGMLNFISARWNELVALVNWAFGLIKQYIINPISQVVDYVGRTIGQIASFIGNAVSDAYNTVAGWVGRFLEAGKNIIDGIVKGIRNGAGAVVDFIKNVCADALNAVKNFFGIKSPSRLMAKMGDFMMQGLQKGIEKTGEKVVSSTQVVASNIAGSFGAIDGTTFNSTLDTNVADIQGVGGAVGSNGAGTTFDKSVNTTTGVSIYQTNNVNTELDMDLVNANLRWELNKI